MYYDEDTITDQPERQIVAELVREKALRLLSQEIPHGIAVVIERMKNRKGRDIVDIEAVIAVSYTHLQVDAGGLFTKVKSESEGIRLVKMTLLHFIKKGQFYYCLLYTS